MKTELHCHTNISDCSMKFDEVAALALEEGVTHLAIVNHDTVKGLKEMMAKGKALGIEVIPGVEMSAHDEKRGRKLHILGYFVEPDHPAIEKLCGTLIEERHEASAKAVKRLMQEGYQISWEQVTSFAEGGTGVFKQHIMHALINAGYTSSIYGDLYKKLFSKNGGIAYFPITYLDPHKAIQAILEAGGIPVLAHPGQYGNFEAVPELVNSGLMGIEVYHPLHSAEDEKQAKETAEEYQLLMTGGSDFHGFYGEDEVLLGSRDPGQEAAEALFRKKSLPSGGEK